ncbi:MAG: hypothetical protein ACRBN8_15730 [Nannocystales bacterium]
MPETVPDILVELLALGELDDAEASAVRAQLEAEGDPRLDELATSDVEVFARYPAEQVVAELREAGFPPQPVAEELPSNVTPLTRAQAAPRARVRPWVAAAVSVAAAAVLVWALASGDELPPEEPPRVAMVDPPTTSGDPAGIRTKGVPRILVHRQGESDPLEAGAAVHAGDMLQLSYSGAGGRHGVIVSLDGAGVASLHFPAQADASTELSRGLVRLEYAYELDDAPVFERFFLVTAPTPLDPDAVLSAARRLGQSEAPGAGELELAESWSAVSLAVKKSD